MVIERGGARSEGRLYLYDATFKHNGEQVIVKKKVLDNIEDTIFRHIQRYYLPAFFLRRGMTVLDFPCGSGYGSEILGKDTVKYFGMDLDGPTVSYCEKIYKGQSNKAFVENDLTKPVFYSCYDLIACIEGIEHIEEQYQGPLIKAFYDVLKPNGTLVVSSPERTNDPSDLLSPSSTTPWYPINKWHKHEMTMKEFTFILTSYFEDVQILSHKSILHNGTESNCLYGVCRK